MKLFIIRNVLLILTFCTILSSCFTKGDTKKDSSYNKDNLTDSFYVKVNMQNDTLRKKEEKGIIKFYYKIADSIKITPKDERRIYCVLSLVPNGNNKKGFKKGKQIKREVTFTPINPNDTIQIPFSVTPDFLGNAVIIGIISDEYELNSYTSKEKVRMLSYEQIFEKEIYIKGGNGRDGR